MTDDASIAFQDCDYAFLVGAKPRGPGHGTEWIYSLAMLKYSLIKEKPLTPMQTGM